MPLYHTLSIERNVLSTKMAFDLKVYFILLFQSFDLLVERVPNYTPEVLELSILVLSQSSCEVL